MKQSLSAVASLMLAAGLLAGTAASAQANLVQNGSFEQMSSPPGSATDLYSAGLAAWNYDRFTYFNHIVRVGWEGESGGGIFGGGNFPVTGQDGTFYFRSLADPAAYAPNTVPLIYQDISGLTVGQQYSVSFVQAGATNWGSSAVATQAQWIVDFGGAAAQSSSLMNIPASPANENKAWVPWHSQTLVFTATSTTERLSFMANGGPGGLPPIAYLDGITVTAVPEPTSAALLLAGAGLIAWRRRRNARA